MINDKRWKYSLIINESEKIPVKKKYNKKKSFNEWI